MPLKLEIFTMKTQNNTLKNNLLLGISMIVTILISVPNFVEAGQISGSVWLDNNGDGLFNQGEPGLTQPVTGFETPTVALYPEGSTEPIAIGSLYTPANGHYSLTNIPTGNYYLCVSNEFRLLGLTVTTQNAGDDSIDNDFDITPCTYDITVTGQQNVVRDLGLVNNPDQPENPGTGEISGTVWLDSNDDGVHNDNEPGAGFINVTVTDESIPIRRDTITDSSGHYEFTALPPGSGYEVSYKGDIQFSGVVSENETTIVNFSVSQLRNVIPVNDTTCTLQDAISSALKNQSIGGCPTGVEDNSRITSVDTLINIEPGSEHPSVRLDGIETVGGGAVEFEIRGNVSIIDSFTLSTSDGGHPNNVILRDLAMHNVNNQNGALTLAQVIVENAVIQRGFDGNTNVFNSTIGSYDAASSGQIDTTTVHGNVSGATSIKNSTVNGSMSLQAFNQSNFILVNSTVGQLTAIELQTPGAPVKIPQRSVNIEESNINGVLISNYNAVIPAECYVNEGIFSNDVVNGSELTTLLFTVDPNCLLN